jgi:PPK2 family polyphosphate:nucleotide phosphotransferase
MSRTDRILEQLAVTPGKPAALAKRDPAWTDVPGYEGLSQKKLKGEAKRLLERGITELAEAQELLWAADSYALLVVFQAMDAGGKDGTIAHVMSGVNPQGVKVVSFKQPSSEELDHDFLWRIAKALPERGQIGIFNRSHYEEVVAVRVHPDWLDRQRLPDATRGERIWQQRYESINDFERHLDRSGTKVIKFFLHLSRKEQKRRLLARLDDPAKNWKFSAADVAERARWNDYMAAYEDALTATSTPWAPWYVVPADHKWLARSLVAAVLVDAVERLDLSWPSVSEEDRQANAKARRELEREG